MQVRRHKRFKQKCKQNVFSIRPTRWTVRGEALKSYLDNYKELMELWGWSLQNVQDTEMKARIRGVRVVMKTFDFIFSCSLGESILRQTDNLSKTLQHSFISAAQAQELAMMVVKTLEKDRKEGSFDLFWELVLKRSSKLETSEPTIPRKRKMPDYFGKTTGNPGNEHVFETPKDRYRSIYNDTYDDIINFIKQRFDQPDYHVYMHLQETLLRAALSQNWEESLDKVVKFYDDINQFAAKTQLKHLSEMVEAEGFNTESFSLNDLIKFLQTLSEPKKLLISEVIKIAKIMLVMPATNALSERSFSALKRVKTYLRSTITDSRLNHILTLHIHKEATDSLNLEEVANEFIAIGDRKTIFGVF